MWIKRIITHRRSVALPAADQTLTIKLPSASTQQVIPTAHDVILTLAFWTRLPPVLDFVGRPKVPIRAFRGNFCVRFSMCCEAAYAGFSAFAAGARRGGLSLVCGSNIRPPCCARAAHVRGGVPPSKHSCAATIRMTAPSGRPPRHPSRCSPKPSWLSPRARLRGATRC